MCVAHLEAKTRGYGTLQEEALRIFNSLQDQESLGNPIPVIQVGSNAQCRNINYHQFLVGRLGHFTDLLRHSWTSRRGETYCVDVLCCVEFCVGL